MRRAVAIALFCAAALAVVVPVAGATLRSPHLTESCQNNRQYAEHVFGPWRVEGCVESVEPQDGEVTRRKFYGDVELNGMIVEGNSPLVATTSEAGGNDRTHRIKRDSAKLVLDPLILGQRRRIVMYSGTVDLSITTASGAAPDTQARPPQGCPNCEPVPRAAAVQSTVGTVDLPVSGVPALLGLRMTDRIEDARVVSDNPGSIEFKPPTSLGATASALLRDWEGDITIKTVDGSGMRVDDLRFRIPGIELPPLGGFEDLTIRYSADRDEWSGSVGLDLGEALFSLDLEMDVSASTGAPTRIEGEVDNLNIAVGNTGIFLQRVNALFDTNPLVMGVGAAATAGPEFFGFSLIEMSGDLMIRLELDERSNFRLEVDGTARVYPLSETLELANGDMHIVIDSEGFISIGGDARYELLFEGIGIAANIGGSGAYATDNDRFNIEAHATGRLELGFLGGFDVVRFGAVVSSDGWGTCGSLPGLFFWVQGGIGQQWERNPQVIVGCNLSPFDAPVAGARAAQGGVPSRAFTVDRGVETLAVEVTADGPEPRARLVDPRGTAVAASVPLGARNTGPNAAVVAQLGSPVQYFFVRNPVPGRWQVQWGPNAAQVTGVRVARDLPPLQADVSVERVRGQAGRRMLRLRNVRGLAAGEQLAIGLKTPSGVMPLVKTGAGTLAHAFDVVRAGRHEIVASVLRDGVPLPARTRVIGRFVAQLPPAPRAVATTRRRARVTALARPRRGAELPDAWQYVLRSGRRGLALERARPGRPVRFRVAPRLRRLTVGVRPVVNGRPLATRKLGRVGGGD